MTDHTSRSLGTVLREAREAAGDTQTDLAEHLKVKQPAVSAWERGTAYPSPSSLVAVSTRYSLDLGDLVRLIAEEQDGPAVELATT